MPLHPALAVTRSTFLPGGLLGGTFPHSRRSQHRTHRSRWRPRVRKIWNQPSPMAHAGSTGGRGRGRSRGKGGERVGLTPGERPRGRQAISACRRPESRSEVRPRPRHFRAYKWHQQKLIWAPTSLRLFIYLRTSFFTSLYGNAPGEVCEDLLLRHLDFAPAEVLRKPDKCSNTGWGRIAFHVQFRRIDPGPGPADNWGGNRRFLLNSKHICYYIAYYLCTVGMIQCNIIV